VATSIKNFSNVSIQSNREKIQKQSRKKMEPVEDTPEINFQEKGGEYSL
jgi:hypothetical protein